MTDDQHPAAGRDRPPRDPSYAARVAARVAERDAAHPGYAAAWKTIAAAMLAHGGIDVCLPLYPPLVTELLADYGTIQDPPRVRRARGTPSDCHGNAARLWQAGKADGIGNGYALSDDGLWRPHSWGVSIPGGAVTETTEPREAYWGVVHTGDGARDWAALILRDDRA